MKNLEYYLTNYNVTEVVQQFNSQFYSNFNVNFYGLLNIAIYERKIKEQVFNEIDEHLFLEGWLPKLPNNEFMDEDFIISPELMVPYNEFSNKLKDVEGVICFQIELRENEITGQTEVMLSKH
jgi:hypothetical protein